MHDPYSDFSIRIMKRFSDANTLIKKQRIIDHFVKKLRTDGLTDKDIIKIAQSSREMISNTDAYKKLFEKELQRALNKKWFIKKNHKKTLGE